ncbi:hypothetical protein P4U44_15280 [Alkalihalobacillus alcalophilus]|uniref:hypothetical protein n=1 Tax=Alkalihalobacillus alcalophilus TaxID=1445 RepID=UPI00027BB712|nr:hypothetical protein [Alkalihalobacillus alcalophilus]MED1563228.1 hypothetical protein [Alkalihalobacillus alcalophilus]
MKKTTVSIALTALMAASLSGCGVDDNQVVGTDATNTDIRANNMQSNGPAIDHRYDGTAIGRDRAGEGITDLYGRLYTPLGQTDYEESARVSYELNKERMNVHNQTQRSRTRANKNKTNRGAYQ